MKVSKFLIAALFTVSGYMAQAKDIDPNLTEKVRNEVAKHILKADWQNVGTKSFLVTFLINSNNEVIVSSTSDKALDEKIKNVLNYQKLNVDGVKPFELYTLPVTIK
ncbi:MAG: hypothetical protein IPN29_15080 [Saprospiraceae bacterium]|nr:hypothetical protein [Saprospiraceae bacterium]